MRLPSDNSSKVNIPVKKAIGDIKGPEKEAAYITRVI